MMAAIPCPARTPTNALHKLKTKDPDKGDSFYGGFQMTGSDEIRISARTLLELLAGTLKPQQFLEHHGFVPTAEHPQALPFFQHQVLAGRTLQSISLERCEHRDDDWVVLKFKGPDPAVSAFQVPT
jgi:hypothetical protein